MSRFNFTTDEESERFCLLIVETMTRFFNITEEEAFGRMNQRWTHVESIESDDIIFHEDEDFWAKDIYYGHDSYWWLDETNAKPLPFP